MKFTVNKIRGVALTLDIEDSEIQKIIKSAKEDMLHEREKTLNEGEMSEDKLKKIVNWLVNDTDSFFREDYLDNFVYEFKDFLEKEIKGYIEYKNGFDENYSCGAFYDEFRELIEKNADSFDDEDSDENFAKKKRSGKHR